MTHPAFNFGAHGEVFVFGLFVDFLWHFHSVPEGMCQ